MLGVEIDTQTRHGLDISIMEYMGWTWRELQETPVTVVEELIVRIEAREHWKKNKKKLDETMK